jgi:hypothetical protein
LLNNLINNLLKKCLNVRKAILIRLLNIKQFLESHYLKLIKLLVKSAFKVIKAFKVLKGVYIFNFKFINKIKFKDNILFIKLKFII